LSVSGKSLAETYEKALIELYNNGCRIKTQYDKVDDPASIDATMNITVLEPWSDPMIHKFFIGSIADLREYVSELEGLKDCICRNENDKSDTRWEYLYSSRMTNYGTWIESSDIPSINHHNCATRIATYENGKTGWRVGHFDIDQVRYVVDTLAKCPYSRRAQMITWYPPMDHEAYDGPCFQSAWFRLVPDEQGTLTLNTNIRFRSNDASRAHMQNFFGFIHFIRNKILLPLQVKLGTTIKYGRINWQADSFHIYGSELKTFEERFLKRLETTTFEERVYHFFDEDIQEMYKECEPMIIEKFNDIKKSFGIIS
jgi:thymidylate synthase